MAELNQVAVPSPSPYRNIGRDVENEDQNAEYLQRGVEDAKERLKNAAVQFHARPGAPEKAIYDQAVQDLLDRTNRKEKVFSNARELEIKAKGTPSKVKTMDFTTPEGGQGIEFNKGMEFNSKPKPTSSLDLSSLMKMAGNAIIPPTEASELTGAANPSVAQEPSILGPYSPANETKAPAPTPEVMAGKSASAINALRNAGVGRIGDKANITGGGKGGVTDTRAYLIDPKDIENIGNAVRSTPEWQRQAKGLDDLDSLIQLQAQRNASKSNIDLSPLGAYLDYNNSLNGYGKTNLAAGLKPQEIEDTSFKDLGDIQRRRADLAKELVNTIKASKVGTYSAQDLYNYGFNGGVQPMNPFGAAHLNLSGVAALKKATDSSFKDNDEQLKAINVISQRIANSATNPSEAGSLPALLEVMDTGSKRILAGVLGMEGYDPSIPGLLKGAIAKATAGMIPAEQRAFLQNRLQKAAQRARDERDSRAADLREYAKSLPVSPKDVSNIVDSHYGMTDKAFPTATGAGKGGSAAGAGSIADEQAKMKMFFDMMKAHEAGK